MDFDGVSTLMPVYMRTPTPEAVAEFRRAAASVLQQECPVPLELLIIDDHSPTPLTDMPELADIFGHPAVSGIRLVRNYGLVFALNAGLNRACYSLIARIDADDFWRPLKLKKQLAAFRSDPDLTIVGTGMRTVHEDSSRDCDHLRGSSWQAVLDFFAAVGCPFPHGSILARKEIFSLLGGYPHSPHFQHCEDFALWGVWVRFFKAAMVEEVLFEYKVSPQQVSTRHAEQQRLASGIVHRAFLELANHKAIPNALAEVARTLRRSLLETGKLMYAAWRHCQYILTDPEILNVVRLLTPDRRVHCYAEVVDLLADRFAYINVRDDYDRAVSAHVRCLHDIDHLARLVSRHRG